MSTKKTEGVTLTILVSGTTVPADSYSNRVCMRGEVVTLTAEQIENTKDRTGKTIADLAADESAQLERWGIVRLKLGEHTEGIAFRGDDDVAVVAMRREAAEEDAKYLATRAQRVAAIQEAHRRFGHDTGQRTLRVLKGD